MDTLKTDTLLSRHPEYIVTFRELREHVVAGKTKFGMSLGKTNKRRFGDIVTMMPHEKSLSIGLNACAPQSPITETPGKSLKARGGSSL
jgi:hypothetical protein